MQSCIKFRPKTFSTVIGQKHVIEKLIQLHKNKKFPNVLLFSGPKGVGKTSVARIISVSVQCKHKPFGHPCIACRKKAKLGDFPIYELNASETTGIDDLKKWVARSNYSLYGKGYFKVFILDELHRLSDSAQNLLLKYLEDGPANVLWIMCTTRADKLLDTLRDRGRSLKFSTLNPEEILELVKWLLKKNKSELSSEALTDELYENNVSGGRAIANAVDNYISGLPPDKAALIDVVEEIKTKPLCRAIIKGDWRGTSTLLKGIDKSQVRLFRAGVFGYITSILLNEEAGSRAFTVAKGIDTLTSASHSELEIYSSFCSGCYKLCKLFAGKGL